MLLYIYIYIYNILKRFYFLFNFFSLGKVCLHPPNIVWVESKFVRSHNAYSIMCDTITSHLIVISVPNNTIASHCHLGSQQYDSCIVMSSHVSRHIGHLDSLGHIRWKLTHLSIISSRHLEHLSIRVLSNIRLSRVHAKPFTTYVPNSNPTFDT